MASYIERRKFLATLGGAAAWPRAARAQQPAMPVIGFLGFGALDTSVLYLAVFRKDLNEIGFVEGQNVAIEYRWAEGRYDRMPELAADLIRRRVVIIAIPGSPPTVVRAVQAATSAIPIVFGVGDDPVKVGLVASLSRPGGHATGINFFTAELVAKRLALLHELVPRVSRIGVLVNPADPARVESVLGDAQTAAISSRQLCYLPAAKGNAAVTKWHGDRHDAAMGPRDRRRHSQGRRHLSSLSVRRHVPHRHLCRSRRTRRACRCVSDSIRQAGPKVAARLRTFPFP